MAAESLPGALAAAQCVCLVSAAARRPEATEAGSYLVELGMRHFLWQRLGVVMEAGQYGVLRELLEQILTALVPTPYEMPSPLPPLVSSYMAAAPTHLDALRMTMLNSLAQAAGRRRGRGAWGVGLTCGGGGP